MYGDRFFVVTPQNHFDVNQKILLVTIHSLYTNYANCLLWESADFAG